MHVLEFILAGFVACLVCGYFQLPILGWTIVAGLMKLLTPSGRMGRPFGPFGC